MFKEAGALGETDALTGTKEAPIPWEACPGRLDRNEAALTGIESGRDSSFLRLRLSFRPQELHRLSPVAGFLLHVPPGSADRQFAQLLMIRFELPAKKGL